MFRTGLFLVAPVGLALAAPVMAQVTTPTEVVPRDPLPKLTVDQALSAETRPLARRVLQMLKVMEDTVKEGKKPGFDESGWARYGAFVDTRNFRRVDIFGSSGAWKQYVRTLTSWARNDWYTGYVRRISQAGNLVYVENIERSSDKTPTGEDGAFRSIAVYTFGPNQKIVDIEIYAQRPPEPAK